MSLSPSCSPPDPMKVSFSISGVHAVKIENTILIHKKPFAHQIQRPLMET